MLQVQNYNKQPLTLPTAMTQTLITHHASEMVAQHTGL